VEVLERTMNSRLTNMRKQVQMLSSTAGTRRQAFSRTLLSTATLLLLASSHSLFAAEDIYVQAGIDQAGQLRIVIKNGREIVPKKDAEQVAFDKPAISQDGRAVGWVALYPNCCTSYPIPMKLMVLSNGRVRTFTGGGLPVWQWSFQNGGKRVAFEQETVHGGLGIHYELRDVATGRLIAEYNPAVGPDNQPLSIQNVPTWVEELNTKR
jgi:hypothetical protein